jgi:transmembrane sensor
MNPNWAYGLMAWIVQQAAKLAPEAVRHRLEEEWSADLSVLDGPILQVRFAFGCCLAAIAMRGDTFDRTAFKTGRSTIADLPVSAPRPGWKLPFARQRDRSREDASAWLERLRRGLREEEGPQLREWLKPRSHRASIVRAAANRVNPEDLATLSEFIQIDPAWIAQRQGRGLTINATAVLMAICIAALPLCYAHYSVPGLILGPAIEGSFMEAIGTVYSGGRHTLRRVVLSDGTRVVLNHGARIAVTYANDICSVLLVRGEATFSVPHQGRRRFAVTVGDQHIDTMAATFNVRPADGNAAQLTVLDGVVSLYGPGTLREANGRSPVPTVLKARQSIETGRGTQSERTLSPLETQAQIAWQRG